jgi:hypothetical protein
MEPTRGWTDSKLELVEIQLLDRVHEVTRDGEVPPLHSYAGDLADDWELVRAAADNLVGEGLMFGRTALDDSLSAYLTPAGKSSVFERRERRKDPRKRAVACRDALLDWCYGQKFLGIDQFTYDVRAHFEGDPFTAHEISAASRDLREKKLISGSSKVAEVILRPQITTAGKTVVESYDSSIVSYENRTQPAASVPTVININTGRINGQLSVGDNNRLEQKTGTKTGELTELIAAVLDAAKGTADEQRIGKIMAQLELEADENDPDQTVIGKVLERAEEVATDTISDALKGALKRLLYFAYGWYLQQVGTSN